MSKPRTITTLEEVEALPAYSLIEEYDGFKRLRLFNGRWLLGAATGGTDESDTIELPAIVLYEPGEEE